MTSTARQTGDATKADLEKEGAPCPECGTPLAAGQRYCLNCGHRRAEPRVEFERLLFSGEGAATANGTAVAPGAVPGTAPRQWNPLVAVGLIALLAIMLLVGVLIGMEDDGGEQTATGTAAQPTTPTATAPAATPPAATTPTTPPAGGATSPLAPGAAGGSAVPGGAAGTPGVGGAQTTPAPEAKAPSKQGGSP